jgi:hypothetical protein
MAGRIPTREDGEYDASEHDEQGFAPAEID